MSNPNPESNLMESTSDPLTEKLASFLVGILTKNDLEEPKAAKVKVTVDNSVPDPDPDADEHFPLLFKYKIELDFSEFNQDKRLPFETWDNRIGVSLEGPADREDNYRIQDHIKPDFHPNSSDYEKVIFKFFSFSKIKQFANAIKGPQAEGEANITIALRESALSLVVNVDEYSYIDKTIQIANEANIIKPPFFEEPKAAKVKVTVDNSVIFTETENQRSHRYTIEISDFTGDKPTADEWDGTTVNLALTDSIHRNADRFLLNNRNLTPTYHPNRGNYDKITYNIDANGRVAALFRAQVGPQYSSSSEITIDTNGDETNDDTITINNYEITDNTGPVGQLVQVRGNATQYRLLNNEVRGIPDPTTRNGLGFTRPPHFISQQELDGYSMGEPIPTWRNDTLYQGSGNPVFVMKNRKRCWVLQPGYFNGDYSRVHHISDDDLNDMPQGDPVG